MIELIKTDTFGDWFGDLRDMRAKARIDMRLIRLAQGNSGDAQPVGGAKDEHAPDHGHDHDHGHVHGPGCSHHHHHAPQLPFVRAAPKQGRNDPCACGSGQKFKKCCGK